MKKLMCAVMVIGLAGLVVGADSCNSQDAKSSSGVSKATVKVPTGSDGLTAEQRNIRERLLEDNKPGSIKHLYVISAYSGQVLIYSTVRCKASSGGKRLTPSTVWSTPTGSHHGFAVDIGGIKHMTSEVLQDDGAYGSSGDYIYWWDTKGVYHQHYNSGGQIIHISNQPLVVKGIIINMEITQTEK